MMFDDLSRFILASCSIESLSFERSCAVLGLFWASESIAWLFFLHCGLLIQHLDGVSSREGGMGLLLPRRGIGFALCWRVPFLDWDL